MEYKIKQYMILELSKILNQSYKRQAQNYSKRKPEESRVWKILLLLCFQSDCKQSFKTDNWL